MRRMVQTVRSWFIEHPVAAPTLVGLGLRLIAAFYGVGWFAPDDLRLGIEQANTWLRDPDAGFYDPIRSVLLSRLMWGLMRGGMALGIRDHACLLHAVYACLGVWSSSAIAGVHRLARLRLGGDAAAAAAWLTAAFGVMPLISTRGLTEVLAIPFLVWGLVWADACAGRIRSEYRGLAAGFILGLACLVRFQLGLVWLAAAAVLGARRATRGGMGFVAGGLGAAMLQVGVDAIQGRPPLGTVWHYLEHNMKHAAGLGVSPWYTYCLHLLAYTVPPATLVFLRPMARALRAHTMLAAALVLFIAVHSCIGHKEDRFMFSVLPLFFVPLGAALVEAVRGARWQRWGARFFLGVNAVVLLLATFSDAHRNLTRPLLDIAAANEPAHVATVGFPPGIQLPRFYLGETAVLQSFASANDLGQAVAAGWRPRYILARQPATAAEVVIAVPALQCQEPQIYSGDLVDRLLVAVNRHNQQRAPTALLKCVDKS